jgi:hypothetical protein
MEQFILYKRETCAACDASGDPCRLCQGQGFTETRVDLVQALQQLGLLDAMRSNAEAVQQLRESLSPERLQEVAQRAVALAHREGGVFRG